jgi:RimJ/RimL family protein N-acetyltransferase
MLINRTTGWKPQDSLCKVYSNSATAISTSQVLLVPYEKTHVTTYHEWMKDPEIQEATASEPLSLEEEYAMQASWRSDHDKLTFIACLPTDTSSSKSIQGGTHDPPERMIGDVNLFMSAADEDEEGCIGELELMIAPTSARRKGYGRATIVTFLYYIQNNLDAILSEYKQKLGVEKMRLLQLRVKIGSKNVKSINLFESLGFIKVDQSPNYFGEFELVLEGFLGEVRTKILLEKYEIGGVAELEYLSTAD